MRGESLRERFARRAEQRANPAELAAIGEWYAYRCDTGTCRSCAGCRPEQRTPNGEWDTWLYLAGRGAGKTRSAAEDSGRFSVLLPGARQAIIAPTYADARDTCVEGESGLLSVFHRYGWTDGREYTWNRSLGEIKALNGSQWKLFSAEKPARLRGPQHHRLWVDELAQVVFHASDAWDMAQFGLRLGHHPQAVATTTPLPLQLIKDLLADPTCAVTRGTTDDNASNLPAATLRKLHAKYDGTRLGRQELGGELLDDIPGALWKRAWLDDQRHQELPQFWRTPQGLTVPFSLVRVVVAVDPAVTSGEDADETGLIVAGLGNDGRYYVLADLSLRDTPAVWAEAILDAYAEWAANEVVIEVNNGGDALVDLIRAQEKARGWSNLSVPIVAIHAKKGKRVRAEPVSAVYEQTRVSHVGKFPVLEDQLCVWTPQKVESPDRLDALVYAILRLLGEGEGGDLLPAVGPALPRHTAMNGTSIPRTAAIMTRR